MFSITESSTKAGEVFRNVDGQYSFMCFHCCQTFEDFGKISSHCDSHFDYERKFDIDVQPQEFVFRAGSEPEPDNKLSLPEPTTSKESAITPSRSSHLTENSNVPIRRRRRERLSLPVDVPQNCPICYVWCDEFRDHVKTVHNFNSRVYQCVVCKQLFKTVTALRTHMTSSIHTRIKCYHCEMEPPITEPSDARRHKCLFCKEWFKNHVEFRIHFKNAHDKDADYFFHKRSNCNIFTCYVCEKEYPLRYYLVAHMRTHHEKFLQHQCPKCGRRLRTFGQLTQHLKTHEGKIYECDQCDKKFPHYVRLRLHLRCHSTDLKFQCDVCSKKFKLRKYLNLHKAVHSDVKKYGCKFCDARFNFTSARRAHEKSQHKAV